MLPAIQVSRAEISIRYKRTEIRTLPKSQENLLRVSISTAYNFNKLWKAKKSAWSYWETAEQVSYTDLSKGESQF